MVCALNDEPLWRRRVRIGGVDVLLLADGDEAGVPPFWHELVRLHASLSCSCADAEFILCIVLELKLLCAARLPHVERSASGEIAPLVKRRLSGLDSMPLRP